MLGIKTIFMSVQAVKKKILSKIKPNPKEERRINTFAEVLLSTAKVVSKAKPIIVGSLGRGTWLKGDHDIDMFLMFDKGVSRDGLEKMGLENAREIVYQLKGKPVVKYAEHPYIRSNFNGVQVDIVPCYEINRGEKIISAVDRSPLHAEYVISRLDEKKRDEVRLLKQFCKGIGVYGSDAKNLGLSGYACELFVIKFGSFENSLKEISKLEPGSIIDIEDHWTGEEEEKHLKKVFYGQPLLMIDPVDKNRNVTAALSCENFAKLSFAASEFLKKPSEKFFFPILQPLAAAEMRMIQRRETRFFAVSLHKPDIIDDILYPQLRKAMERLVKLMQHNEFRVIRSNIFSDEESEKLLIIFELECWQLPFINNIVGPPIFATRNSRDFLRKYAKPLFGPFVIGSNWVIDKQRNYRTAEDCVKDFLCQNPDKLHENGIPKNIAKEMSKSKIIQHSNFWKLVQRNKKLSSFLREKYFAHL